MVVGITRRQAKAAPSVIATSAHGFNVFSWRLNEREDF
jgi:hypothetical protein